MQQQIKVGSIIEIVDFLPGYEELYSHLYPLGSKHEVLAFHPVTGEVEVSYDHNPDEDEWHTFFPGEYRLVE